MMGRKEPEESLVVSFGSRCVVVMDGPVAKS